MTVTPRPVPPLVVDGGRVRRWAGELLAVSALLDDVGGFVARAARVDDWAGEAADAYHAAIRRTGGRADAMSRALRDVAHRVQAHADALDRLVTRREDLVAERAVLLQPVTGPGGDREGRLARFEADLAAWERDLVAAEAEVVRVLGARRTRQQVADGSRGATGPAVRALADRPPPGAPPVVVRAWWAALAPGARRAAIAAAPGTIGNLAGVPAAARHTANTLALERDLLTWTTRPGCLAPGAEARLGNALAARDALDRVSGRVDPVTGEPVEPTLLAYDPGAFGGDGRVAIGVGDLDTADHVAVVVPGLGTDAGSASTQADRATTVWEATRFLHDDSVAALAWIGYDAPDNLTGDHDWLGVVGEEHAARGGARLAEDLDGLRASRPHDPAHLTVIGNSYGSTTTARGATDHGLPVDDVVLAGSPGAGAGADDATDLDVGAGHVWVATSSHDPVAGLADNGWLGGATLGGAGLGDDPAEDSFGARRVQAESVDRADDLDPLAGHTGYFDHDSESLANIAHVVAGAYADVTPAEHRHDPWYTVPVDPEEARLPATVPTRRP